MRRLIRPQCCSKSCYSRGISSSHNIDRACREHNTFIAGFVSSLGDDIAAIFSQVLFICDKQGLIGREMFSIDGVKLPSNASKAKSGTRADFERQAGKLEAAAKTMLERHRDTDQCASKPDLNAKETQRIARLQTDATQIRQWLSDHPEDRKCSKGLIRKSNRTDSESAKMATQRVSSSATPAWRQSMPKPDHCQSASAMRSAG